MTGQVNDLESHVCDNVVGVSVWWSVAGTARG